jgi:pimeloyl-ACP methyl ester carboxylesterase
MAENQQILRQVAVPMFTVALLGALAGCGPELGVSQQGVNERYRFVLVHGAFQGPYVWDKVAQHLEAEGESVTLVTLPAHWDDPAQAPDVTMADYVQRVSEAVHAGSMPVHLVGHSMAGMVISQFAENEPTTLKDLVYFAALVPQDGQTLVDVALADTTSLVVQNLTIDLQTMLVKLPVSQLGPIFCHDCSANEVEMLQEKYRDDAFPPGLDPMHLTAANFGSVSKKYIYTSEDRATTYAAQLVMSSTITLDRTATMVSSHEAQVSHDGQFTDVLLDLVR